MFGSGAHEHDEILLLDCVASLYGKKHWALSADAEHLYTPIPLAIGGAISSTEEAVDLLSIGADKILVNTRAIANPQLITEIAQTCGRQAVILQVDTREIDGNFYCFTHGARNCSELTVKEWVSNAQSLGAGEVHITAIDTEGVPRKFPPSLASLAAESTNLPIILSGGIRSADDIASLHCNYGINAFSFSSLTNTLGLSVSQLRLDIKARGLNVR